MFTQHGIPNSIVSDNGSSFTSSEFQNFCKMKGIKHYTSAPYKPASDGQAERAVQIIKNGRSCIKEGSIQSHFDRVLLNHHTRPLQTTSGSPAKLLMGRELTTRLSLVHPDVTVQVENNKYRQKRNHDQTSVYRNFQINDPVYVLNSGCGTKWLSGIVVDNIGEMMFLVKLCDGRCTRKHVDQLRLRHGEPNIEPAQVPLSPTPVETPPAFDLKVFLHESFSPINVPELLHDPAPLIEKPTAVASKDSPPLSLRA